MKKLIGYGYTNSSGVATMTKNASGGTISGYVGTGAGLMNFRAEMHDDSTVVSEPYSVLDTLAYDKGILDDPETRMFYGYSSKFTRESDGTTLTDTSWNIIYIYSNYSESVNTWSNTGIAVEFEVLSLTGSGESRFTVNDGSSKHTILENTGTHLFKIVDGTIKHFVDGTEVTGDAKTYDNTVSTVTLSFVQTNSARAMKFKEFKVYPI